MYVQPSLFLGLQPHGLGLDRGLIVQSEFVVVLGIANIPDVHLPSCQPALAGDQPLQEAYLRFLQHSLPELTLGKRRVMPGDSVR